MLLNISVSKPIGNLLKFLNALFISHTRSISADVSSRLDSDTYFVSPLAKPFAASFLPSTELSESIQIPVGVILSI